MIKTLEYKNGTPTITTVQEISNWLASLDIGTNTKSIFTHVGFVRRCISIRALAISTMPYSIYRGSSVLFTHEETEFKNYEFLSALNQLLMLYEASLILTGNAYAIKVAERGRIARLHYCNPETIRANIAPSGITHFSRTTTFGATDYTPDEMIAVFDRDPFTEIGTPIAEIVSVQDASNVLRELAKFIADYAKRGLIKGTILSIDSEQPIGDEEKNRLKRTWERFLNRARFKEKETATVFSKRVTPIVVGEGLADFSKSTVTPEMQKTIATSLGVPQSLLMSDPLAGGTAEAEQINFYTFTVIPRAKLLQAEINRQLLKPLGLSLIFEPKKLEIFQRYELQRAQAFQTLVGRPIMTVNEARERIGFEPIRGEDELFNLSSVVKAELKAWKTKLKKNPNAEFKCIEIPQHIADIVRERLSSGKTLDDVFREPFEDF